jgi:hypothetical protein
MPKNLTPEDRWETDFEMPIPGEPRRIGPLEVLFQHLLNRTERLKGRIGAILGLPWDATPPDTLAGLAGRVSTLETNADGYLDRGLLNSAVNWNTLTTAGVYRVDESAFGAGSANTPPAVYKYGVLLVLASGLTIQQIFIPHVIDGAIYFRQTWDASYAWSQWFTAGLTYGSNSNGSYIRFADGTQVCWAKQSTSQWNAVPEMSVVRGNVTVYYRDLIGITFPAAFSSEPSIITGGDIYAGQMKSIMAWTPSASSFNLGANYQISGNPIFSYYIAIGRWK